MKTLLLLVLLAIFCVITNRFFISMLMSFHENIIIISFIFLLNSRFKDEKYS